MVEFPRYVSPRGSLIVFQLFMQWSRDPVSLSAQDLQVHTQPVYCSQEKSQKSPAFVLKYESEQDEQNESDNGMQKEDHHSPKENSRLINIVPVHHISPPTTTTGCAVWCSKYSLDQVLQEFGLELLLRDNTRFGPRDTASDGQQRWAHFEAEDGL